GEFGHSNSCLTRVQLNNHGLVYILSHITAIWHLLEYTRQLIAIYFNPLRMANLTGKLKGLTDACLFFRFFTYGNNIAWLYCHGRDVSCTAVYFNAPMVDELTCFCTCRAKAHTINDVVQARLE